MLFKKSYARGALQALIDANVIKNAADEEVADALAQAAGSQLPAEPMEAVSPEVTTQLAVNLVQLADALQSSADSASQAASAAVKGASTDEENTLPSAASENEEAKMDEQARPEGYANVGVAGVGTQAQSGEGAIGKENPNPPTNAAQGSPNSAIEAIKGASLKELIKKVAAGLVYGDKPEQKNDLPQAAKVVEEAKMDEQARPIGYASEGVSGVGNSAMAEKSREGAIGKEEKKLDQPGTNSAVEQSKMSEDAAYQQAFTALSDKYARFLPKKLSVNEKVAALQYLMGLIPSEREKTASSLKTSGEMPAGLAAYVAEHKEEGGEKKEEKKEEPKKDEEKKEEKKDEEKKEEEKKSSSRTDLLARLRNLK